MMVCSRPGPTDAMASSAPLSSASAFRYARVFAGKELALLRYVRKLTLAPQKTEEADVVACRDAGCADAEIFEANQVCAYFNYSNRLLNGLGVTTQGDLLGFSPPNTDKLDDWEHQ